MNGRCYHPEITRHGRKGPDGNWISKLSCQDCGVELEMTITKVKRYGEDWYTHPTYTQKYAPQ